jgi:hypothetical protein
MPMVIKILKTFKVRKIEYNPKSMSNWSLLFYRKNIVGVLLARLYAGNRVTGRYAENQYK